ncbi:nodulation protein E [Roseateles aquatilis]|uniref:Nodulation protein E n=2 Tax=Roseateles aquatilis TaxID=431061 RepID=A0A246JDK7_9BURK|nr:nodulation protein E [Roseateles aquatilis]
MVNVCVSGLGVVAPNGSSLDDFWASLVTATSAFSPARSVLPSRILAAELGIDALKDVPIARPLMCDRSALIAIAAASRALDDARLTPGSYDPTRVAVVIGNGAGGQTTTEQQYQLLYRQGHGRISPLAVPKIMGSSTASWVSIAFGLQGPAFVLSSACASGTHAIGVAAQLVQSGVVDVAVTGGVEACLTVGTLRAWEAMGILATDTCRPFARGRAGLVLAEGAGLIVLESEAHARARKAPMRARYAGYGSSADAGDLTKPSADGMARAMRAALAASQLLPREIDYVNAHGTGTKTNDRVETEALHAVFGRETVPLVSSTKSVTGHALGAAGGLEAVASVLTLQHHLVPPTANFDEADPECALDCVPNIARPHAVRAVMSNSFAFGGLNASVVFVEAR